MPPFYSDQYSNQQYPNQYPNSDAYPDQYGQYQYPQSPQGQSIPPFSQIQVNVPPRLQQFPSPSQMQYNYQQNFQPNYAMPSPQQQHQYQYPIQHQIPMQYQQMQHQNPHLQPHQLQHVQPPPPPQHPQNPQQYYQHIHQQVSPRPGQQAHVSKPQAPPQRVLKDTQPQAPRQQMSTRPEPTPQVKVEPKSEAFEPDYEILLLSLADEYLEAAQKLPVRSEEYYKLTATALGCIEAVLNNFKLPSLREAQVSLRYAQLLYSETENYDDAERILTKTIDMCEQLKYHDLRYAAQLLLTRVLHKSRPKAAVKDLQGMIQDIEAYKHTAWEYAFRLQYVMYAVSHNSSNDLHAAVAQLERIEHLARQSGDHAVLAFAATLEALIHLHTSNAESFQSSQRALAKARALQLNPDVAENPQICLMMELVDLCGYIKISDIAQSEQKRKTMQQVLYPALQKPAWRADGLMYVPINQSSLRGLQSQDSGLIMERNGKYHLAFSWLSKGEVEDLGYLLSGISAASKNAGDNGKAEKFLDEGLGMIREILEEKRPINNSGEIMRIRQQLVECHFLLELAFLQCSKGHWAKAQATVKAMEGIAQELGNSFPADLRCLVDYVKGSIFQGSGNLDAALKIYQSPRLNILTHVEGGAIKKPSGQSHRRDDTIRNVSILATINTLFIIQQPHHPQNQLLPKLINTVDPLANQNPSKPIQAAWNFLLASLPNNSILMTKQYLGNALSAAQSINNAQITTLCLVTMQERFFKGVVGDQAVKCARAASHQARRLNEPMWIAVASALEGECLDVHGMIEDSRKKKDETERVMRVLPERVRASMTPLG